ncbi:MAG: helix-turn-helix domain-containing protein [Phycisphaerae bacterium]
MQKYANKEVLTTGEVASICHVAPRTVSKWFDTGKLRGYRIPGSRDRRIPRQQLEAFMRAHGIPLDALTGESYRVLIVDVDPVGDVVEKLRDEQGFEVTTAKNGFEAGVIAQRIQPNLILLDVPGGRIEEAIAICRNIKDTEMLRSATVMAAVDDAENSAGLLRNEGFDEVVPRPYTADALLSVAAGSR